MLERLRTKAESIGRTPTVREVRGDDSMPSPSTYRYRFGSFSDAVGEAGLDPRDYGVKVDPDDSPRLEIDFDAPEIPYILGVCLSDGYVETGGRWRVRLRAVDEPFVRSFADSLSAVGMNPNVYDETTAGVDVRVATASSKSFCKWFHSLGEGYTREILSRAPAESVRGLYEGDGSCTLMDNGRLDIVFSTTEEWLADVYSELLGDLGFDCGEMVTKRDSGDLRRIIVRGPPSETHRFVSEVGPVIKFGEVRK